MAIFLESYAKFWWGFQCDKALKLRHTMKMKTELLFFRVQTHFAWSHHIYAHHMGIFDTVKYCEQSHWIGVYFSVVCNIENCIYFAWGETYSIVYKENTSQGCNESWLQSLFSELEMTFELIWNDLSSFEMTWWAHLKWLEAWAHLKLHELIFPIEITQWLENDSGLESPKLQMVDDLIH